MGVIMAKHGKLTAEERRRFILAQWTSRVSVLEFHEQHWEAIEAEPGLLDFLIEEWGQQEQALRRMRLLAMQKRDGSNRNCETCGSSFAARRGARYCSPACRQKAYRSRVA